MKSRRLGEWELADLESWDTLIEPTLRCVSTPSRKKRKRKREKISVPSFLRRILRGAGMCETIVFEKKRENVSNTEVWKI